MTKVKGFGHYEHISDLTKAINVAMKNKEIINVSLATPKAGYTIYYSALVLYKE